MKFLLDTHILFWWVSRPDRLSAHIIDVIGHSETITSVSMGSLWEMAIKHGLVRWPEAEDLVMRFEEVMTLERFLILPMTVAHVRAAGLMPSPHRDPFDRLLAAQATLEGMTLVTVDPAVIALGAPTLS
jgi:PIN domain nuclease of toxin-antitoxin system